MKIIRLNIQFGCLNVTFETMLWYFIHNKKNNSFIPPKSLSGKNSACSVYLWNMVKILWKEILFFKLGYSKPKIVLKNNKGMTNFFINTAANMNWITGTHI